MPSPSSATIGQGTQLKQETAPNSGIYEILSEMQTINGPNEDIAITEVTNHDSANFVREWINGLIDPGSLTGTANALYGDTPQDNFYAALHARQRTRYQVLPSPAGAAGLYQLLGLPIKHGLVFPSDGKQQTVAIDIKLTSLVTFTP